MGNLIISLETIFSDLFGDVQNSLRGRYRSRNENMEELMEELKNTKIPTAREDRENLKKDGINVVNGYKRALELYEQE